LERFVNGVVAVRQHIHIGIKLIGLLPLLPLRADMSFSRLPSKLVLVCQILLILFDLMAMAEDSTLLSSRKAKVSSGNGTAS
jgi:hypothetical protein